METPFATPLTTPEVSPLSTLLCGPLSLPNDVFEYWRFEEITGPYIGRFFSSSLAVTQGSVSHLSPVVIGDCINIPANNVLLQTPFIPNTPVLIDATLSSPLNYAGVKGMSLSMWIKMPALVPGPPPSSNGVSVSVVDTSDGSYVFSLFTVQSVYATTEYNCQVDVGDAHSEVFLFPPTGTGFGTFAGGSWHFLVVTYDQQADQLTLYLDNASSTLSANPLDHMSGFPVQIEIEGPFGYTNATPAGDCAFDEFGF